MEGSSSRGNRSAPSSQQASHGRVSDSPQGEQGAESDEDAPVTTSRRASGSTQKTSKSRIQDSDGEENDENVDPAVGGTPASANSAFGKRRRLSTSGRAAAVAANELAQDGEEEDAEDDETPPPPGSSTSRVHRPSQGDDAQDDDDDDADGEEVDPLMAEEAEERKKPVIKPRQLLIRDPDDGYVMGSIVRIKCYNFLTYYNIECHPGPHLNMIFGPNGSGKSSLVAAIALGLGFPPKVMQRGKHISSYVKQGTTEGYVEIELKGRPGKKNLTVKRSFQIKDNKSAFEMNGKAATKADVAESVERLHVNINNLCTFLPQDRVADFAKMSGDLLLKETQRTADETLLEQQEQLVKLKEKLSTADRDLEKNKTQLVESERKMATMERDVRRHRERQAIEDALLIEEVALPYAQYTEARDAYQQARRDKNVLKERLDTLRDNNAPLMGQRDALKDAARAADTRRKALTKKRDEVMRHNQKTFEKVANIENRVENLRAELKELKATEKKRKDKIDACKKKITDLEAHRGMGPPEQASPEVTERSRELRDMMLAIKDQVVDLQGQHEMASRQINAAAEEHGRLNQQLQALNDVQRRREEQCRGQDNNLWLAFNWVRRNRETFKGKVYDPIRILVSVKDKAHARVAEAAINYSTMKTIVCLEKEDYTRLGNTFTRFKTSQNPDENPKDLRVNIAELPADKRDPGAYERPCTQEQLQGLGFDAFVIDLLEGPPEVLAYLCYTSNLHRIPVAYGDGRNIAHDRLRQPNTPFRRYITNNTVTDIQFSRYGNRGAIVQDVQTRDPQLFAESIDQNRKRELDMKLADVEAAKKEAQKQRDDLAAKDDALRSELEVLKVERTALDAEKKKIDDARIKYERLGLTLRTQQGELSRLQAEPSVDARRQDLATQMKALALKRVRTSRELDACSGRLIRCHVLEARPLFAQLQAVSSQHALETALATRSEEQTTAVQDFEKISKKVNDLKTVARTIFEAADEGGKRVPARLQDTFTTRMADVAQPADVVEQRVEELRGQLEVSQQINPGVVKRYEELKASVDRLRAQVDDQTNGVRGTQEKMERIRAKWYPRVKEIVDSVGSRFSAAMQSLGCLGEASIKEDDDDYSKWAIRIQVAFRDGEKLADLSPYRQSGGERSLTTMMYLISLLQMSKVPFSLVDEINQGMDPRAERAVHNHLVKAVCEAPDVGQYFLLTPKLLTNLHYHPKLKILCVNNGEWLPDDGLPIRKILNKKLKAKRAAAGTQ